MINWKPIDKLDHPFESRDLLVWYQRKVRFANLYLADGRWMWDVTIDSGGRAQQTATLTEHQIRWWSEMNSPEKERP